MKTRVVECCGSYYVQMKSGWGSRWKWLGHGPVDDPWYFNYRYAKTFSSESEAIDAASIPRMGHQYREVWRSK